MIISCACVVRMCACVCMSARARFCALCQFEWALSRLVVSHGDDHALTRAVLAQYMEARAEAAALESKKSRALASVK